MFFVFLQLDLTKKRDLKKKNYKKTLKMGRRIEWRNTEKKEQLFFRIISAVHNSKNNLLRISQRKNWNEKPWLSLLFHVFVWIYVEFFFLPNFDDVFFIQIWLLKWEIWRGRCTLGNLIIFAIIIFFCSRSLRSGDLQIQLYSLLPPVIQNAKQLAPPCVFFFFFEDQN